MVRAQQVVFVLVAYTGVEVLAEEVADVGGAAALADRLPVDHHDVATVFEEEVVGAVVEVHERVRHGGEAGEQLGVVGPVAEGDRLHLFGQVVAEHLHERVDRSVVDGFAGEVQRAVDDGDERGCVHACAVPETGVVLGQAGQRRSRLVHGQARDLVAFGEVAEVFHEQHVLLVDLGVVVRVAGHVVHVGRADRCLVGDLGVEAMFPLVDPSRAHHRLDLGRGRRELNDHAIGCAATVAVVGQAELVDLAHKPDTRCRRVRFDRSHRRRVRNRTGLAKRRGEPLGGDVSGGRRHGVGHEATVVGRLGFVERCRFLPPSHST